MEKVYRFLTGIVLSLTMITVIYFQPLTWADMQSLLQKAAVVSAGLQEPDQAVLALTQQLHKAAPSSTTSTTPATETASVSTTTHITNAPAPPRSQKGGTVSEQQLPLGTPVIEQVAWNNRSGTTLDIPAQFKHLPDITITDTKEPQVLIVHTHTIEGYMSYYAGYYNDSDVARTKDGNQSVVAAGREIASQLEAAGIGVIHDVTVHDSPQYTGAYDRSAQTIQKNLKKYPSIRVVLDIHRDAIMPNDTTKVKPTVEINGQKAAQVMIIAGTVTTEEDPNPYWQDNLRLGLQLQNALASRYEGLVRPLSAVASRYNQHLNKGSLLIEVGTDANTVAESVYAGALVGQTLADVLWSLKDG